MEEVGKEYGIPVLAQIPIDVYKRQILNLVTGKYRYKRSVRNQKKKISSALQMAFGGALAVLAVISAVSIWWR